MVGLREFNIIVAATNGGGIGYKGMENTGVFLDSFILGYNTDIQ